MSTSPTPGAGRRSPEALLAPVEAFLSAPRIGVLSSLNADQTPYQVVVHYLPAGDHLLVNGSAHRRWVRNLRRDGHVALLVPDGDDTLHWVGIRGVAGRPSEGPSAVDDAKRIAVRYGEDPSEYEGLQRVSYRITPRHVYEYTQR